VNAMDENLPDAALPQTTAVFAESDVDSDYANFSAADARLERFIAENDRFDGASIIIVHKTHGIVHEAAFGDQALGTAVLLASTSKVPSVSLLMALADDPDLDFDIDTTIENYLPWEGVYPGISTAQLVSNTSGIPSPLSLENPALLGLHSCQFVPFPTFPFADNLLSCVEAIYTNLLPNTVAPGTRFDYAGSQWHLAAGVAEVVGGDTWAELFDRYIAQPCELEIFEYGNYTRTASSWRGAPSELPNKANPNIEAGAMTNLRDMAKLLALHLNDGVCGDTQVIPASAVQRMRLDVGSALGSQEEGPGGPSPTGPLGYGMGWWVRPTLDGSEPTLFMDPGAYGSLIWLDTNRDYAAFVAMEEYSRTTSHLAIAMINDELIPLVEEALDDK
jgi:CubicO group peptidase (beta-lactamase class C family)